MPNPELLPPHKTERAPAGPAADSDRALTLDGIRRVFAARRGALEALKPRVSLNFYYGIEQKIAREERQLLAILNLLVRKNKILEQYSFILDRQYFEQKFLPPEI